MSEVAEHPLLGLTSGELREIAQETPRGMFILNRISGNNFASLEEMHEADPSPYSTESQQDFEDGDEPESIPALSGDLTGGHWVTIDHQDVYLVGDTVESGHLAGKSIHQAHEEIAKGRDREAKNYRGEEKYQRKAGNREAADKAGHVASHHEAKAAEIRSKAKSIAKGPEKAAPRMGYHAGPQKIDKFKTDMPGDDNALGPGAYFAHSAENAERFYGKPGHLHAAEVSMEKPFPLSSGKPLGDDFDRINEAAKSMGHNPVKEGFRSSPAKNVYDALYKGNAHSKTIARSILEKAGFDGMQGNDEFAAFHPDQIKIKSVKQIGSQPAPVNSSGAPTHDDILHEAHELKTEKHGHTGVVPTDELRSAVAKRFGVEHAGDSFDKSIHSMKASGQLRDTGAGLANFAEPSTASPYKANPSDVKESDIHSAIDAVGKNHPDGMAPIHEVRDHIRAKLGDEAASHKNLDPAMKKMRYEDKVRMIPVSDGSKMSAEHLQKGVPGEGETFGYLSKSKSE